MGRAGTPADVAHAALFLVARGGLHHRQSAFGGRGSGTGRTYLPYSRTT
jgi:hypothetical protein